MVVVVLRPYRVNAPIGHIAFYNFFNFIVRPKGLRVVLQFWNVQDVTVTIPNSKSGASRRQLHLAHRAFPVMVT